MEKQDVNVEYLEVDDNEDFLDQMLRACYLCCRSEVFSGDSDISDSVAQSMRQILRHFVTSYIVQENDLSYDLKCRLCQRNTTRLRAQMAFTLRIPKSEYAEERFASIEAITELVNRDFAVFIEPHETVEANWCLAKQVEVMFNATSVVEAPIRLYDDGALDQT